MLTVDATKLDQELADAVNCVVDDQKRVILQRNDTPIAAVISLEDLRLLEHLIEEDEDRIDIESAERILSDPQLHWVSEEQVRQDLGL